LTPHQDRCNQRRMAHAVPPSRFTSLARRGWVLAFSGSLAWRPQRGTLQRLHSWSPGPAFAPDPISLVARISGFISSTTFPTCCGEASEPRRAPLLRTHISNFPSRAAYPITQRTLFRNHATAAPDARWRSSSSHYRTCEPSGSEGRVPRVPDIL